MDKSSQIVRTAGNPSAIDPVAMCTPLAQHRKEHGFKGVEGVVEHWQHFHMRKGRCFVAPCCSKTPTQDLGKQCHGQAFESLTKAMDHMIAVHKGEVEEWQKALLKDRADKAESWKHKGKAPVDTDVDPKDFRSVVASLVCEMMEMYANRMVIPCTTGRGRWFPIAQVGRLITGYFLGVIYKHRSGMMVI
jgi:hypothetical protein